MAINFNGSSQGINLGTDIDIIRNVSACTLMVWAKPTANQSGSIISIAIGPPPGISASSRAFMENTAEGALFCGFRATDGEGAKTGSFASQFVPGEWAHFAVTCDYSAGIITGYKNGVQVGVSLVTFAASVTANTNSKNGGIGAGDDIAAPWFNGAIEDVRVYGRLITGNEMLTIAAGQGADGIVSQQQLRISLNEGGEGLVATECPSITESIRLVGVPVASPIYVPGIIRGTRSRPSSIVTDPIAS
jgi:hypothetical protein